MLEKNIKQGVTVKAFSRNTNSVTESQQDLYTVYEYDNAGRLVSEMTPENYKQYISNNKIVNKTEHSYDVGRLLTKAYRGQTMKYDKSRS